MVVSVVAAVGLGSAQKEQGLQQGRDSYEKRL